MKLITQDRILDQELIHFCKKVNVDPKKPESFLKFVSKFFGSATVEKCRYIFAPFWRWKIQFDVGIVEGEEPQPVVGFPTFTKNGAVRSLKTYIRPYLFERIMTHGYGTNSIGKSARAR